MPVFYTSNTEGGFALGEDSSNALLVEYINDGNRMVHEIKVKTGGSDLRYSKEVILLDDVTIEPVFKYQVDDDEEEKFLFVGLIKEKGVGVILT